MSSEVRVLDFTEFKKTLDASGNRPLDILVKKCGAVYVAVVTRDRCPSCEEQKPLFEKLSNKMKKKYADQTEFLRVHSSCNRERTEEAKHCLDAFHTAGFPTYIITVRDNEGNTLETYRSLDAPISETERNIKIGITVLGLIRERSKTHT
jgi:thiol-disulfide isomerase/thioredoxin